MPEAGDHPNDVWRNGYRQNTKGFGLLLRHSKPLDRVMRYVAVQHAHYYRKNAARGSGPGPHNADMVRVEKSVPGGRKKDRMEFRVVAYGPRATHEEFARKDNEGRPLRRSLVFLSEGRRI